MLRNLRLANSSLAVILALSAVSVSFAETKAGAAMEKAPIPVQIAAAKKVFVSYCGVDSRSLSGLEWSSGDPDQAYDQFYAEMKHWGRYELASAPAAADLVFEIRFATPIFNDGDNKVSSMEPQWQLSILDVKTHFTLWTITEPVKTANRQATWAKNVDQGMANLMSHLKKLTGEPESGAK
jgi:hypothetical protein